MMGVKGRRVIGAILFWFVLVPGVESARGEFKSADWQYYKVMELPQPGPDGFVAIAVTEDIFTHAEVDLRDLRVIGPGGEDIPYVLVIQEGKVIEKGYSPQILNQAVIPGVHQEFILDLGAPGQKNNQIQLSVPEHNFRRPARVYGSDDALSWKLLRSDFYLFDVTGDVQVRDLTLRYPTNIFRFLKVELGLDEGEPLTIESIILQQREMVNREVVKYPLRTFRQMENTAKKVSEITVELAGENLPVSSVILSVSDSEFYRSAAVFSDPNFKHRLGEGVLYRYGGPGTKAEQLSLSFPEKTVSGLYIRIANHDNPPLAVTGVKAEGFRRLVVFRPPSGSGEVRLYYGAAKAGVPVYDLVRLYPRVAESSPPLGSFISPETKNPDYEPPPPPPQPKNYTLLLWLVLIPAAAALLFLVFRSLREMGGKGEEGSDKTEPEK